MNVPYIKALDESGSPYLIDTKTGEIVNIETTENPEGTIYITPAQQRIIAHRRECEAAKKLWRTDNRTYSFVNATSRYSDLDPQNVGRLMYLSTYLGYNTDILYRTQKTLMTKKDLQAVLKLSKSTFYRFWSEVYPIYLFQDNLESADIAKNGEDLKLHLNKAFFYRGTMQTEQYNTEWQKLYRDAMRDLYNRANATDHQHIGLIFQMLPFVNYEYNILCNNPDEKDFEKADPITFGEFCRRIGYTDTKHYQRIMSQICNITFIIDGRKEHLIAFSHTNRNISDEKMFVNPRILYKGRNFITVQGFEKMF